MNILFRALSVVIGYLLGSFNTAYFLGLLKGVDVRETGSGNPGATNAMRALGAQAGAIVFIGDALKAVVAAVLVALLFGGSEFMAPGDQIYMVWAGLGVMIGHDFPFYLKFKGGKGISSMLGLFIVIDWRTTLIGLVVFIIVVLLTRYVSLGSLAGTVTFYITWIVLCILDMEPLTLAGKIEVSIISGIICALTFIRHRKNIKRLLSHTEKKIGIKEV